MMPEIFSEKWQVFETEGKILNLEGKKNMELLKAARLLEVNVFTSSPIM